MYARVVYSLKKNQTSDNNFSLYRKEMDAEEFSIKTANATEASYEIASRIKNFFIEYGFINNKKTDTKKSDQSAQSPTEITWLKSWETKQEKSDEKTQKPLLPKFIKMKIIFTQEKTLHEQEYEFLFTIPIDTVMKYQSFTQKNSQQEAQRPTPTENNDQGNTSSGQPPTSGGITIPIKPNPTGN